MLIFDYKESEQRFFAENNFENYDIKFFNHSLNEETFEELTEDDKTQTSVISIFSDSMITDKIINGFTNLRTITTRANHYDNINRKTCMKKHIAVLNIPNYGKTSVAEFTIGLMINLIRKIPQAAFGVKNNTFWRENYVGYDLKNMNVGIVGTGCIGSEVCKLLSAFGTKILAYDISLKNEICEKYNVEYVPFDELLTKSDIISVHVPYNGINYHMFSQNQFEKMKNGVFFINISQGELVDHKILKQFIENGKIQGAALDIVSCMTSCDKCKEISDELESSSLLCLRDSDIIKELASFPNVIITPEIAAETKDSINHILIETFYALQDQITGGNSNRVI